MDNDRTGTKAPPDGDKKYTVMFARDTYQELAFLADSLKITIAETIRRAIALLIFYYKTVRTGNDLMVRNGKTSELEKITML